MNVRSRNEKKKKKPIMSVCKEALQNLTGDTLMTGKFSILQ